MASVQQIVDELRRRGVTVHEWSGWVGRGNEGIRFIDAKGGVLHHTASGYGSAYAALVSSTRPDLYGGMLANFAGNADGSLTVLGTGCAWHAGGGVGPNLGRVLSKLPNIRNTMNYVTVGLEIVYPGDKPMTDAQYQAAVVFTRVVADLCAGGDVECVRGHAETNGAGGDGKWDPGYAPGRTIDLAALRRAAANLEDDMAVSDEDLRKIYNAVWNGVPGAPLIHNYRLGHGEWPATTLGALEGRIQGEILPPVVGQLQGEISGLKEALKQIAANPGAKIDLSAVEAAARKGASDGVATSVESLEVVVKRNA